MFPTAKTHKKPLAKLRPHRHYILYHFISYLKAIKPNKRLCLRVIKVPEAENKEIKNTICLSYLSQPSE